MAKKSNTFRLTDECNDLLKKLSEKQGVSQAAIIEILVRDEAKKQKVK
ncbi:ribbon-helix-helix protein, CopG family [Parapedobacter lycopersici]|nr:ribbon-helix-helix protein, CopG family [Parapedobacter lycopersici]